jgi:transposase-like protein
VPVGLAKVTPGALIFIRIKESGARSGVSTLVLAKLPTLTTDKFASTPQILAAFQRFQSLLDTLRPKNPSWIKHLETRAEHYLAFFHYPRGTHCFLRTTNLPEGLNNLIETMRRNAGGHFHSEREAMVKMKLLIDDLHQTRWKQPLRRLAAFLQDLARLFQKRFELELL